MKLAFTFSIAYLYANIYSYLSFRVYKKYLYINRNIYVYMFITKEYYKSDTWETFKCNSFIFILNNDIYII